jgi:hypothetical protein
MSGRSWFVVAGGQQAGPYSETLFKDMIGRRSVTPDTLVWSEGMSDWQRASDVPGLLPGGSRPPAFPPASLAPATGGSAGGSLSAEFDVWGLFGRSLLLLIGDLTVIPAPWVATGYYRWLIGQVRVPQRPNLAFTGKPGDIWYVLVILAMCPYADFTGVPGLSLLLLPLEAFLSWIIVRWILANISSEGRRLPLAFEGSAWAFVGWHLLLGISVLTIIGSAWVITAWMRWICRNIAGTRRTVVFNASGWQMLWRSWAFGLCVLLIIPIPWILRWYTSWYVSQFALVEAAA